MVGDRLTGLTLDRRGPVEGCIKACNDRFARLYDEERDRHIATVRACQGLRSNTEKNQCLTAEARFHEAKMRDLTRGKKQCHDNCHRQGAGGIE